MKVFTGLNKQLGNSKDKEHSNNHLTEQYSRHNDDDSAINSIDVKLRSNTSIKNTFRENKLCLGKISNLINKNSTLGYKYDVSKEQTSQDISQELLDSSSKIKGLVRGLPSEDIRHELQK